MPLADLRQSVRPEDQDDDHKDDEELGEADAAHMSPFTVSSCPGRMQVPRRGPPECLLTRGSARRLLSMRRLCVAAAAAPLAWRSPWRAAQQEEPLAQFSSQRAARRGVRDGDRRPGELRHRSAPRRFRGLRGRSAADDVAFACRRVSADGRAWRRSELEHGRRAARPGEAGSRDRFSTSSSRRSVDGRGHQRRLRT